MPITNLITSTSKQLETDFRDVSTRLQSINLSLAMLGRTGVPSEDSTDTDAQDASVSLDRVCYTFQLNNGHGWWFNREPHWRMTPDTDGFIFVPNNILSMIAEGDNFERNRGLTIRGSRIYDLVNHSYDMRHRTSGDIYFDFIVNLPFNELPPSAKMYASYRAALNFTGTKEFDANRLQITQASVQEMYQMIHSEDVAQTKFNLYLDNDTMRGMESQNAVGAGRTFSDGVLGGR